MVTGFGLLQKGAHLLAGDGQGVPGHGGRQQAEVRQDRVPGRGALQRAAPGDDVGKVHHRPVAHAQGQVQVAQAHVGVDAQRFVPGAGQGGADAGDEGCFAGASLSGGHHIGSAQNGFSSFGRIEGERERAPTHRGLFLIWEKRRGYLAGVGAIFSMRTTRWAISVPGMT